MAINLSPLVYWAQTAQNITLKVDLKDVKDPNIDLKSNEITFSGYGLGARETNTYSFHIDFYTNIDPSISSYKIHDSKVDFTFRKCEDGWWPRITSQPQKPHWLRVDFDKWHSEEDNDETDNRNIMTDYPGMYEKLQKEEYGYRKEQNKLVYLIFYNFGQFIGFLYIMLVLGIRYYRDGNESMPGTYAAIQNALKFCQILQYLEVMHPMFGYTKGGTLMPFLQVTGRNFILFIMIDGEIRMQTKPVVFYLVLIWSSIELIRYPYYITSLIKKEIGLLTWLRYTIWIPLYPLGVLCEGIVILRNIPYFEETNRFSVDLPNKWNFAFCMPTFLKIYLLVLVMPGLYFLMSHMNKVRVKKLQRKPHLKLQ